MFNFDSLRKRQIISGFLKFPGIVETKHWPVMSWRALQVGNYFFKVNSRNTRTRCEICSKLTIKTPERRQWHQLRHFGIFIFNFEHISLSVVMFLLLTLSKKIWLFNSWVLLSVWIFYSEAVTCGTLAKPWKLEIGGNFPRLLEPCKSQANFGRQVSENQSWLWAGKKVEIL